MSDLANSDPVVHVVDDDEAMRKSLRMLLRSIGLQVVCYADGNALLESYSRELRGCIVSDLRMPGLSGTTLMQRLADRGNRMPFILISGFGTIPLAVNAVQAGAFDFLEKPYDEQTLLDKVQAAMEADARSRAAEQERLRLRQKFERLSRRESEVLHYVVRGYMNKQIAAELKVSQNTIEVHRSRLMRKLGVGGVTELVRLAVADGLISAEVADFLRSEGASARRRTG